MRTSVGFFMSRLDRIYDKPPQTVDEMIRLMESRGLSVPDREKARHYLTYINYYRLSGYGFLFEEPHVDGNRSHRFWEGVTFDHLLKIYLFDRHLRLLILDAIERIEVGFRTVMIHQQSQAYQDGHWYLDSQIFKSDFRHTQWVGNIRFQTGMDAAENTDRHQSRESFLSHYYKNYDDPELPPSWMLIEVLSLGTWSKVYANLRVSKDRKRIARVFDLPPATLESWMHSLTYLRNLCAHHSRIYGRKLAFPPALLSEWPELPPYVFSRFIAVMEYMLRKVSPDTQWGEKVKELMEDEALIRPELLGIQNHDFWECELIG